MVEVLQFKVTVWPKVASESTYEAQKFQNFLGDHTPDPLSCFCIPYCKRPKAGRGLGTRLLANIVCPRCALASAVSWLRHWCLLLGRQSIFHNTQFNYRQLNALILVFWLLDVSSYLILRQYLMPSLITFSSILNFFVDMFVPTACKWPTVHITDDMIYNNYYNTPSLMFSS